MELNVDQEIMIPQNYSNCNVWIDIEQHNRNQIQAYVHNLFLFQQQIKQEAICKTFFLKIKT